MSRDNCAIGKDIKPASYKGVSFLCQEVDYAGGRRVAHAEYPFANHTNAEDMGIKLKIFNIKAVFRENDHVGDARALFAACESPGPGILVHPTYGAVNVICNTVKVKDNVEEKQGESEADIEFLEFNSIGIFGAAISLFGVSSINLNNTSRASFQARYRPALISQPWRIDVINRAQSLVNTTATEYGRQLKPTSPVNEWRVLAEMQELAVDDVLAASATNVDNALTEGSFGIVAVTEDLTQRANAFRRIANAAVGSSDLPVGIATESEEAVLSRTRVVAVIGMAETAMAQTYDHVDAALRALDSLVSIFQDEMKAAYNICDNGLFLALREYSINVSRMMYDRAYRLPSSIAFDFGGSVYPLIAAYVVHSDAKRHREFERRNVLVTADGRFNSVVVAIK